MPDLSGQEFYEIGSLQSEPPKPKFFNKKRMFWLAGIIVAIIIVVAAVLLIRNYFENRQAQQAIEQNHVAEIDGRLDDELEACQNEVDIVSCENRVRSQLARSLGEVSVCENITGDAYGNCVSLLAYDQLDETLCKVLTGEERSNCEDLVILTYAQNNLDLKACNRITISENQAACIESVQSSVVSQGLCKQYGVDEKLCDANQQVIAASQTGNSAECEKQEGSLKDECLQAINSIDQDQDGLTIAQEFQAGTSDQNSDSDSDSINDYDEIELFRTNPNNSDTDGDGYSDAIEIINGFDPLH